LYGTTAGRPNFFRNGGQHAPDATCELHVTERASVYASLASDVPAATLTLYQIDNGYLRVVTSAPGPLAMPMHAVLSPGTYFIVVGAIVSDSPAYYAPVAGNFVLRTWSRPPFEGVP
jgi:hypothetical protein